MLIGTIGLVVFLALCILGVPIAFALIVVSAIGLLLLVGIDPMISTTGSVIFNYIAK